MSIDRSLRRYYVPCEAEQGEYQVYIGRAALEIIADTVAKR